MKYLVNVSFYCLHCVNNKCSHVAKKDKFEIRNAFTIPRQKMNDNLETNVYKMGKLILEMTSINNLQNCIFLL